MFPGPATGYPVAKRSKDTKSKKKASAKKNTCGVKTLNGTTCNNPPGWGTDKSTGPCCVHLPEAIQATDATKGKIINALRQEPNYTNVAAAHKITYSTLRLWRENDPQFDSECKKAIDEGHRFCTGITETAIREQIQADVTKLSATLVLAFLNRHSEEWRTVAQQIRVRHSHSVEEAPADYVGALEEVREEDADESSIEETAAVS